MMRGIIPGRNPFLDQFMKTRAQLGATPPITSASEKPRTEVNKRGSTTKGALPEPKLTLGTIIADKPKADIVRQYLESRVEELTAQL